MRKQWIKKENIYHKPFYKHKLKMTLLSVLLMAIIFFAYQLFYIKQLQIEIEHKASISTLDQQQPIVKEPKRILRGIRLKDYDLYNMAMRNAFFCIKSGKAISIDKLNDDYCDCEEDGSDEPETNACKNGLFYCTFQKRHRTGRGRDLSVPSSRINDGICDCCDGSDEWLERNGKLPNCINTCSSL